MVVLDAAVLLEAGWQEDCHEVGAPGGLPDAMVIPSGAGVGVRGVA